MRSGELARRAGVNIETLRFYERKRLLRAPSRTVGGYRDYSESDLETVRFIKQCQHLGFTLREIGQLEELHRAFPESAATGRPKIIEVSKFLRMSQERIEAIDEKIQALQAMRASLSQLARELQRTKGLVCPASRQSTR
jgi:DNA-binding transcriptional MerR regulator